MNLGNLNGGYYYYYYHCSLELNLNNTLNFVAMLYKIYDYI